MKLLDCTLRDGGYYTNWDFNREIVESYINATNKLPIDYLEVGYRNKPSKKYMGKYAYCPVYELKYLRARSTKKLAIMLNERNTDLEDLDDLLLPIIGLVDMIRMAVDPKNLERAVVLAKKMKQMGFEVGFNMMYMSKWKEMGNFYPALMQLNENIDLFCMVDSFGGVMPDEIKTIITEIRKYATFPIGFHGHNNMETGLVNSIVAIQEGVDYIDATILGMGRGAGNTKMELLLTYLNSKEGLNVDFNELSNIITSFTPLQQIYAWGTNLPYMIAGANSFPQKEVMAWVCNRLFSFNNIVRALKNRMENQEDNGKFPLFDPPVCSKVLIVGGGNSVREHQEAVCQYLIRHPNVPVVHSTAKNALLLKKASNPQYYCLTGSEEKRLNEKFGDGESFKGSCILPPYPRLMGTNVPEFVLGCTFELPLFQFAGNYKDSCTALALEVALSMRPKEILFIGYDGYSEGILTEKERDLSTENEILFDLFVKFSNVNLISLTPTLYRILSQRSIYQNL